MYREKHGFAAQSVRDGHMKWVLGWKIWQNLNVRYINNFNMFLINAYYMIHYFKILLRS